MTRPPSFKAGIIQFDVETGDAESNLSKVLSETDILADQGAELVLLPEMWSCGFDNKNLHKIRKLIPFVRFIGSRKAK